MSRWRLATLGAVVLLTVTAAACGGGGDESKVVSLGESTVTSTDGGGGGKSGSGEQVDFEDAMLDFAACMREYGVDMPDPTFSDNGQGGIAIRATGDDPSGGQPSQGAMEEAAKACDPIMEEARSNMPQPSPEEQAKMQDDMVKFATCMREQGVDMPDPTFSDNGSVSLSSSGVKAGPGDPAAPDAGTSLRVDPAFEAAMETCQGEGAGGFTMTRSMDGGK